MVLGPSAKNRKEASIHVNYQIHIQEIKPWPPSQSLRSMRSVMIQWQIGDRSSGFTKTVVPSLGPIIDEGKIEFNESFRLPVTLLRDMNVKNKDADTFLKKCLEFNLYEPRREKAQLLATATIDLADYGIVKEILNLNAPMNCKRSFSNAAQPVLFIRIQPVGKAVSRTRSSLRDGFSKDASLDKKGGESVSDLMNEQCAEEAEIASFTDDDVSLHSSQTVSSSAIESNNGLASRNEEIGSVTLSNSTGSLKKERDLASKIHSEKSNMKPLISPQENLKGRSSRSSSISSELEGTENNHASVSNTPNSSTVLSNKGLANIVKSSLSSFNNENAEEDSTYLRGNYHEYSSKIQKHPNGKSAINGNVLKNSEESAANHFPPKVAFLNDKHLLIDKIGFTNSWDSRVKGENDGSGKTWRTGKGSMEAANSDGNCNSFMDDEERKEQDDDGLERENFEEKRHSTGDEVLNFYLQNATRNQVSFGSDSPCPSREDLGYLGMKVNILKSDRLKHVKSVRSSSDIARNNVHHKGGNEIGVLGDVQNIGGSFKSNGRKDTEVYPKDTRSSIIDSKIQQLELKVKILEEELREAASTEAALYSVVAEHGSSMSKVHAPARRLSRLYLHACKERSQSGRASAARSAVSGLVLVAKACGNDVPRLTFWLSNSVVLRTIISQATRALEQPFYASQRGNNKISSPLKWNEPSPHKKENRNVMHESFSGWKDPCMLSSALEKVEAWIFSRIIESVWWQTLTPHMQSGAEKVMDRGISSGSRKNFGRTSSSADQDQVNFSLDHWKKAFKDACERLCPVRAGGHECGCLRLLASLIMEQCVARLDVAMFNAILRESADGIPTDPVSDPISDPTVLPIPAGKASFGAGVQLKNAIGNWSRWLSDLFGMDYDDSLPDDNEHDDDDDDERQDLSFKSFHLLNALSDLMMLPKDLLLSQRIRKEVCPSFGASMIKRVLDTFVPDEFCPEPIPDVVLEALYSEGPLEAGEESITSFPCIAAPPVYSPPSAASVASIIGEFGGQSQLRRSESSVVRKSYISDDELDELNSPLAAVFVDGFRFSPVRTRPSWSKGTSNQNSVRYELLRDIWMNSD